MSEASGLNAVEENTQIVKKPSIPIKVIDLAIFDDTLAFLRDKFDEQMRRVDEQMLRLGEAFSNFNKQELTVQSAMTTSKRGMNLPAWKEIMNSPLIEGEGDDRVLKLQFDVSHFDPSEVSVRVSQSILKVSAVHSEKDDKFSITREYNRQFQLPRGTNPNAIVPMVSRDGILTVEAPFKLNSQEPSLTTQINP